MIVLLLGCPLVAVSPEYDASRVTSFQWIREAAISFEGASHTAWERISINSDDDFVAQNWSGAGSQENPYLIQGLRIKSWQSCISISNTRSHVVIRDCLLGLDDLSEYVDFYYSHSSVSPKGVNLRNTTHVRIINCTIQYVADGVELGTAKDCRILGNTFWYCAAGIYTPYHTENLMIQNNTIFGGSHGAIIYSVSSVMDSNTIVSTWGPGLEIHGENNSLLRNRIGWCDPNAYDYGGFLDNQTLENRWHDGVSTGNSWSDWESGAYEIRGDAGAIDRFPSAFIGDFSGPSTTYHPWSPVERYDVWSPVNEVGFSIDFNDPCGVDTVLLWYRLPNQEWDFVVMSNFTSLYHCTVRIPECPIRFSYFYSSNDTQGYESFTGLIELVVDFFSPPSYLILNVSVVAIITVAILATNRKNLSKLRSKVDAVRLETYTSHQ